MHRFYLPPDQCQTPVLFLTGGEAHRALHVLRLRRGERVAVLDGAGQECRCEVQDCESGRVRLAVVERRSVPPRACRVTLLQALPKGKLIESIIQKATELGAARIVPLLTERVVSQFTAKEAAHKAEKWQGVAIEAIKQCGSAWLPLVETPTTPREFLARGEAFDLPLIASLHPGAKHPREYFQEFQARHRRRPGSACVWIGPEGDFTPAEIELVQAAGVRPVTLGPLVLRTETAAIYSLSVLNYESDAAGLHS